MSLPLTPSKRPSDQGLEPNGKAKRQNSVGKSQNQPSPGTLVYRVLCPAAKCGNFLENGGIFISQIHEETGMEVRVEESVPGCDERVVVILGSGEVESASKMDQEDRSEEATADKEVADAKEQSESNEDKEPVEVEDLKHEKEVSSAQRALLLVFERLVEGETEPDVGDEDDKKSSPYVLRLLVLSSQVGCVLGKGGSVIKQMSNESGAQIQILPRDKLPLCTSPSDDIVQITGEIEAVRKALLLVSQQLSDYVPRDHETSPANTTGQSSNSSGHALHRSDAVQGAAKFSSSTRDGRGYRSTARHMMPKLNEGGLAGQMRPPQEVLCFRLLCSSERVGGIIGKGGNVVRTLEQDTRCEIKVVEGLSDAEDRIVAISGAAYPEDRVSAVQDAVLRVQNRIVRSTPDSKDNSVTARMLVSSNQIGCLLGKGGSVIAEMRKSSGAYIRILGKDQIPTCASENEEVVQINGEYEAVQDALLQITSRLKFHFFRDVFPMIDRPSIPPFLDPAPPFPSFMGRRELSPPGMYSSFGPSTRKFDTLGGPRGAFYSHEDPPFMQRPFRPGLRPHIPERGPWGQSHMEGGGPLDFPDFAGPPRRIPGFGGSFDLSRGSQPAIITNTTVEVVVPRSIVPVIYGEEGGCLKQIRQISDARITITEPKPGATDTVIIISGTPEQTHAAQSLIQAFVMIESESA
ncbi:KH domain-containing protein HEN4-like [Syzygium oleosum]|uniref:KH domain-containing protein HEN4-like n=1 Tax=Syzygium oleosum TaxID=219896 RepID=UPI0024BAE652|nr:KH domain-containing protein HEN4-like [Syzygium oleosum]